ncbi:hypothetical protein WA026_012521 [Henosepilachna vigintioctopunctata]|uniref:Uncharacterized protein n=1 Tax=Henosepilachna vigintioctopunctata TaxID=420089 RepID=A0AAW1TXA5_9CUCU
MYCRKGHFPRKPTIISSITTFSPTEYGKRQFCVNISKISLIGAALSRVRRACRVVASSNRNEFSRNFTLFTDIVVGKIGIPVPSLAYKSSKLACDVFKDPAMYNNPKSARISTASVGLQSRILLYDGAFFRINSLVFLTTFSTIFSEMNKLQACVNVVTPTPFLRIPASSVRIFWI